jgi:thiol-disulfide isomerase/thioredoxin
VLDWRVSAFMRRAADMTPPVYLLVLLLGLVAAPVVAAETEAMPSSSPAFAVTFKTLEGKPMTLAEWKGRIVVLNFWATWCSPCRTEIPHLEAGRKKYASRGVVFIGAAIEDGADAVRDFAKANGISYPVLMAGSDNGIALLQALGNKVAGLPFTIVLDRQGNVVAVKLGILTPMRLQQILEPLL